jgi:hypothetical protein
LVLSTYIAASFHCVKFSSTCQCQCQAANASVEQRQQRQRQRQCGVARERRWRQRRRRGAGAEWRDALVECREKLVPVPPRSAGAPGSVGIVIESASGAALTPRQLAPVSLR